MNRQSAFRSGLVVLLGVAACVLLSSCGSDQSRVAVGLEGGGQRMIPPHIHKMWEEEFSDEQWMALLHQRIHQPRAVWRGIRTGSIRENGSGLSFTGLVFQDSQSHLLEHQLRDLMEERPLMFLPLLHDADTDVVLTGVAAYQRRGRLAELMEDECDARIADAYRHRLLGHRDVRVRYAAIYELGTNHWLTAKDIERGLNDETDAIRVTTAFFITGVIERWQRELADDRSEGLDRDSERTLTEMLAEYSHLAPVLLDHVNDNHFHVRHIAGLGFRSLFTGWTKKADGKYSHERTVEVPERFDWVRSDWHSRRDTQQAWKQWWDENGLAALRQAHAWSPMASPSGD